MSDEEVYQDLIAEDIRETRFYIQGREAHTDDIQVDDCPYPPRIGTGRARTAWMCGWYDTKYELFWERWLEKQSIGNKAVFKKILQDCP